MDETKSTPIQEQTAVHAEGSAEQALSNSLEVDTGPVAAEAGHNGPKTDDGTASAQAQVASVILDDQVAPAAKASAASGAPVAALTAADVDVIEPEWVKKAEQAVAANREDPRAEEYAVEAVQVEYLKKRYNLDVKPGDPKP